VFVVVGVLLFELDDARERGKEEPLLRLVGEAVLEEVALDPGGVAVVLHLEDGLPRIVVIEGERSRFAVAEQIGAPVVFLAHDVSSVPERRNVFMRGDLEVQLRLLKEAEFIDDPDGKVGQFATAVLD
jgi:hypothetical protein